MRKWVIGILVSTGVVLSTGCPGVGPAAVDRGGAKPFELSAAARWNEVALAAVRHGPARPTVVSRSLFILNCSMYDAWAAYDATAVGTLLGGTLRRPAAERTASNKTAAVSYAAYRALKDQFPEYEQQTGAFTSLLRTLGLEVNYSTDATTPAGVGNTAAQAVLDFRQEDGANEAGDYADTPSPEFPETYRAVNSADATASNAPGGADFDPDRWQPLRVSTGTLLDDEGNPMMDMANPATYSDQLCLTPHWGAVVPFALTERDQFRPVAPPQAGSDEPYTDGLGQSMTNDAAWNQQVDEVVQIMANLTDRQKAITEYWAEGPRAETPAGHWHALAEGVAYRDRHTIDEDVKMYFALSGALFDTSVSVWEAKRAFDYIRPQSAVRHKYARQQVLAWGGPGRGVMQIDGSEWMPYQPLTQQTPPSQDYVSEHSGFAAAAAEVLTRFIGSNTFHDGETVLPFADLNADGVADLLGRHVVPVHGITFEDTPEAMVVLEWPTFQDAAEEAALSRRYGGIHFQDGDLRAREMGTQIGRQAFDVAEEFWNGER